jgi:hypothetical protein
VPALRVAAAASAALAGLGLGLGASPTLAHGGGGGSYTTYYFPGSVSHRAPHLPGAPSPQDLADLQLKPLIAAGPPPAASAGPVTKGGQFFAVGVRHAITGVLTSEVRGRGWFFSDKPLPAGQAVYGIPMAGSNGAGMVWCAPLRDAAQGEAPRWRAACIVRSDDRFAWIEAKPAMMTLNLDWIGGVAHVASAPSVERRPVDFPAMTLSYAFGGWNKDGWLILNVRIDWGEGPQPLHSILVPPAAEGAVDLHVMRGELVVKPAGAHGEDATVEVRAAPQAGESISY